MVPLDLLKKPHKEPDPNSPRAPSLPNSSPCASCTVGKARLGTTRANTVASPTSAAHGGSRARERQLLRPAHECSGRSPPGTAEEAALLGVFSEPPSVAVRATTPHGDHARLGTF